MTIRVSLVIQLIFLIGICAWTTWRLSSLPDVVPVHWGIDGKPDRMGSKWETAWIMPIMILFMAGLTLALPRLSPKNFDIVRFGGTFNYVMVLVSGMMSILHVVIIQAAAGAKFDIGQVMMAVIFAFFALMGNVMGKVKQNFYMGIRTPWTLADARVWDETHRQAAHLWFIGGILGAILSVAGMPFAGSFAMLMVIALLPVAKSYQIYRKLGL